MLLLDEFKKAGFFAAAILDAKNPNSDFQAFYKDWLSQKKQGVLPYLENTSAKFDLNTIFEDTKSMLVALHPYVHEETTHALKSALFKIARYAWGRDYHNILRSKIKRLLKQAGYSDDAFRIVIDSTPVNERYYARLAGLGFIGRNALLIHPTEGSYFFITLVLFKESHPQTAQNTSAVVSQDIAAYCGDCNICVSACPTNALKGDGTMDAGRCISMLTIENKDAELYYPAGSKNHRWVFGCDVCQMVCPYNKKPIMTTEQGFAPLEVAKQVAQGAIPSTHEELYGSPLRRAGVKLHRNIKAVT